MDTKNLVCPQKTMCYCKRFLKLFEEKEVDRLIITNTKFLSTNSVWSPPVGSYVGFDLYNSAIKDKVKVTFPHESYVSWFSSGPHGCEKLNVAHACNYVKQDIIQRIMRYHFNINLITAMNLAYIDDVAIEKSIQGDKYWREISFENEERFFYEMRSLNVMEPNLKLYGVEYINEIIQFISKIIDKKLAYINQEGAVYFNVRKYNNYGKFEKLQLDDSNECSVNDQSKFYEGDFLLWKPKEHEKEPGWISPWGRGRPTYHVESSALASYIFGSNVDIYAGDMTMRFPSHEYTDAVGCVYHGTDQWVNYWLHIGHLYTQDSTYNDHIRIEDILKQYNSDVFRIACLITNYQDFMNYNDELMQKAKKILNTFQIFQENCWSYLNGTKPPTNINKMVLIKNLEHTYEQVGEGLKDLNTSHVIQILLDQVSSTNRCLNNEMSSENVESPCFDLIAAVYNYVLKILDIFGLETIEKFQENVVMPNMIAEIIQSNKISLS